MIGALLERLVAHVLAHRALWALVGCGVMALGLWGITRIQLEDDARSMIASADPEVAQALEALSEFTAVDQLLIHIDGRALEGSATLGSDLQAAARQVEQVLRDSGQFHEVRWQASPQEQLGFAEALLPRRFLIDPQPPQESFAPEALRARLMQTRELLLTPQGILQKELLLADPVGSLGRTLATLSGAPGLSKLDPSGGTFYSVDGTGILMLAAPKGNPFGGGDAQRTMEVIAQAQEALASAHPQVVLRPLGAHRYQEDAQRMVMYDVHLSAALTFVIVMAIFVAFFRRLRLALVAFPPLLFGVCVAGGVAGFSGRPIHGIVLAFSAACLGLSIDYTIHLLAALQESDAPSPAQALPGAARRIGSSLALAALSTASALGALSLSSVAALRQMSVLAMAAIGGSFLGNLLWVPVVLPLLGKEAVRARVRSGPWTWAVGLSVRYPGAVLAVVAVTGVVLLALARDTRLDGDLSNLDTHTAAAVADEEAFAQTFGDPTTTALMLSSGRDLNEALQRAHQGADLLGRHGVTKILSPTLVAPPPAVLEARRWAWCEDPARWIEALRGAAVEAGFRPEAFQRFERDLAHTCAEAVPAPEPALDALGTLLGRSLYRAGPGAVRIPVAFEASKPVVEQLREAAQGVAGVAVIHQVALNQRLMELIAHDLPRLGGVALLLIGLLLGLSYRNLRQPLRALAPCLWGGLVTLGVFAATGTPINLMNLCVFPLLCGLGIDYGVLMVDAEKDPNPNALRERAFSVTVASATTCAGFGTLAVARYYAIATIGQSVLLAVVASALAALVLPEALRRVRV